MPRISIILLLALFGGRFVHSQQLLTRPSEAEGNILFGLRTAVYDQDLIVTDTKNAYYYQWVDDSWVHVQTIESIFPTIIDMNGDWLVVGRDGQFSIFEKNGSGVWVIFQEIVAPENRGSTQFGWNVALSGSLILVSDHSDTFRGFNAGAAWLYSFDGAIWTVEQEILDSSAGGSQEFGSGIYIDSEWIIVSARTGRKSTAYKMSETDWTFFQSVTPIGQTVNRGLGAYVHRTGDRLFISDDDFTVNQAGWIHYYSVSENVISLIDSFQAPNPHRDDGFGQHMASIGNYLIVFAPQGDNSGRVFVYDCSDVTCQYTMDISPTTRGGNDIFGNQIQVYQDQILIASRQYNSDRGEVFLFPHVIPRNEVSDTIELVEDFGTQTIASVDTMFIDLSPPFEGAFNATGSGINLTVSGSELIASSAQDFFGSAEGTVEYEDTYGSSSFIIPISIQNLNDPPSAMSTTLQTAEDQALNSQVAGIDVDGDQLNMNVVSTTSNGILTATGGLNFRYVPNQNFNGADSFVFRVTDGLLESNEASLAISVSPVNDPPSIPELVLPSDRGLLVISGEPADSVLFTWTEVADVDGDELEYHWVLSDRIDFSELLHEYVGADTSNVVTVGELASTLSALGVAVGFNFTLHHMVSVSDGSTVVESDVKSIQFREVKLLAFAKRQESQPRPRFTPRIQIRFAIDHNSPSN